MKKSSILEAPLDHVRRQFKQNCLFQFGGAIFLSTPEFIGLVRTYLQSPEDNDYVILLDTDSMPVEIEVSQLKDLYSKAYAVLKEATITYKEQKIESDNQFNALLERRLLDDEETM